MSDLSGGEGG
uniref:Uncharacterized protein n=1 Tax=Arundo donax TaxID=35708 RepID=A0A0A9HXV3_ARUDO